MSNIANHESTIEPTIEYSYKAVIEINGNMVAVPDDTPDATHSVYEAIIYPDKLNLPLWIADFVRKEDAILFKDLKTNIANGENILLKDASNDQME